MGAGSGKTMLAQRIPSILPLLGLEESLETTKIYSVAGLMLEGQALVADEDFLKEYQPKYPKACECLQKDREDLFTFYDFPAEHWIHLRTTDPIESTFATVRHRQRQTKGNGSCLAALTMAFKLAREGQKHWNKIHQHGLLLKVVAGVKFEDGVELKAA